MVTKTDIKHQTSSKLGHIALHVFTSGFHILYDWKKPIFDLLGMLGLRWAQLATCFQIILQKKTLCNEVIKKKKKKKKENENYLIF